jgi:predicted dehydrogenase
MKVVLAGCGAMSQAWLKAANSLGLEMVGFVDLYEEAAQKRAVSSGWPQARFGTDLQKMLNETKPDLVFDCTVPEAHTGVTLTALANGCHVLGEKPMAESLEDARKMVAAAQQAGKIYAVIQNRRYDHNVRRLKEFLKSGSLGPLTTINSDFYLGAHFEGFRLKMPHVLLVDMAIHTFDTARFISDADPVSVYCKEWNPAGSWYDRDASAVAIFEMSNGLVYTYRGSWCSEGMGTTWESDWRVIGQQGSLKWDGGKNFAAQVVVQPGGFFSELKDLPVPEVAISNKEAGHSSIIQEMVECIQTGKTPETVCTDNIKSLAMVLAAVESAEKGRSVEVKW